MVGSAWAPLSAVVYSFTNRRDMPATAGGAVAGMSLGGASASGVGDGHRDESGVADVSDVQARQ